MEEKSSNDSSSHMSIFDESINEEENIKNENENNKKEVVEKEEEKILKFQEKFLGKKRKELTEEEKKERIQKNIDRYCHRNNEMLELLAKINSNETTHKNINRMMRLLAADLSDTKKLINQKSLIYNQKKEIFKRLLNFTFEEYQYFWYQLTDGKLKKGNAQLIKSSNISKAKEIIKSLEEKKNVDEMNKNDEEEKKKENSININSKNNKTIKEIIQAADLRDIETEKFNEEILGTDNDISSDDSLSSSSSDFDEDIDNNSKNIDNKNKEKEDKERKEKEEKERKEKEEKEKKEKEEKKRKEKEEKERKEKEEKERKEKEEKENKEKVLKQTMEEKDEIDIFN